MIAAVVYVLSAFTAAICAALLWRGYRRSRVRLLMWSSLAFLGLAANNAMLFVDRIVLPDTDLALWRKLPALIGLALLVWGQITEEESR